MPFKRQLKLSRGTHVRSALIASVIACAGLRCDAGPKDEFVAQLNSPEPDIRIAAVRELQTSLDPRIPDAMLSLLADKGNSIRRLAARAIGSRWWQIPKERGPQFITALGRNENSDFEDERNMVARAIGLLTRDYKSKMFACSANKRWAIYERRGLPCLIDTKTDTEELLGWPRDDTSGLELFLPAIGNEDLNELVSWHPDKEAVALLNPTKSPCDDSMDLAASIRSAQIAAFRTYKVVAP